MKKKWIVRIEHEYGQAPTKITFYAEKVFCSNGFALEADGFIMEFDDMIESVCLEEDED